MTTAQDSSLGREVAYPKGYDPTLLFPIPRAGARSELGLAAAAPLPFTGHDRWMAYELSWLDARGKPQVATATLQVPHDSPSLIESKSLKLYLNSLNGEHFDDYGPPNAAYLDADDAVHTEEHLASALLKSNCPVTGQPDWASLHLRYRGPRIDRAGLLRYIVSFREHAGFHEQCVEQIFLDVLRRCRPASLSVEARYTRRGGLDINPWRATADMPPPPPLRDLRQ